MKQRLGTNSFSGLNVAKAPHLIEPHELTVSENGWTDQIGCWMTAKGPTRQYSGYTSISAFVAARIGGADHLVWYDSGTIYDNGTSIGSISLGSAPRLYACDDGVLIYGDDTTSGAKNYIYDGDHLRELGVWQPTRDTTTTDTGLSVRAATAQPAVSSISKASSARITFGSAHGFDVGDYAYVSGGDMTEITGRPYIVTAVDTSSYLWADIEVDSTNFTTYTTGATVYRNAAGLSGNYKWYLTLTVELSDGSVLESRPLGLGGVDEVYGYAWEAEISEAVSYTLSATDQALVGGYIVWDDEFTISGTRGTDYIPGARLYRTKNGGVDFYLEKEWQHGDSDFVYGSGSYHFGGSGYVVHTPDNELGAVYLPSMTERSSPPRAKLATTAGQRMFFVPSGSPNEFHWTELDGIEYSDPLSYIKVPDTITAIYGYRDRVVIWSADRMWVFDLTGGLPDLNEIVTPVGTTYDQAIARTDLGVLFLRKDGLWLFDGIKVQCVSRKAFASISEPKAVCAAADTIYISGESDSYVIRIRDDGWTWHEADEQYIYADDTSGVIYGTSLYNVDELFTGDSRGGKMTTMEFSVPLERWTSIKAWIDVDGDSGFDISLIGNTTSDTLAHYEPPAPGTATRRMCEVSLPRHINEAFRIEIEASGNLSVKGLIVEVTK